VHELDRWYSQYYCPLLDDLAVSERQILSHTFNHLLALFYRPSIWIATAPEEDTSSDMRPSIEVLLRPFLMVLIGIKNGSEYVALHVRISKHSIELTINAFARIRRLLRHVICRYPEHLASCKELVRIAFEIIPSLSEWNHLKLTKVAVDTLHKLQIEAQIKTPID
jgi:hypothetical protein